MLEKIFKLKEKGTTVKTEVIAGITTFLAMAYILAVNPNMLSETIFRDRNFDHGVISQLSSCFSTGDGS